MSVPKQRPDARPAPGMICKTRSVLDQAAERAVAREGSENHDDVADLADALLMPWGWGTKNEQDSFGDNSQARKEAKELIRVVRSKRAARARLERLAKQESTSRRIVVQNRVAAMARRRKAVEAPTYPVVSTCCALGERDSQQDRIGEFPDLRLFVVADGMGGHTDGDRAAEAAVAELGQYIRRSSQIDDPATVLQLALQEADRKVFALGLPCQQCESGGPSHKMSCHALSPGTTLTALWLTQGSVWVAHVGDSRAYQIHEGCPRQLTEDHAHFGMLRQCVGRMSDPQILGPLPPSGQYLLCSDGLTGTLPDEEIARVLGDSPPIAAARALVQAALAKQKRGQDNVSAIVITLGPAAEMRPAVPVAQTVASAQGKEPTDAR